MYSTMRQPTKPEPSRSSIFGPIVLVGLGILLLLSNLDVIDLNFWELLFRFWPVFLIGAGLDILVGRRANGGALIALMLTLGVIFGAIWLGYVDSATPFGAVQGEIVSQPISGASQAQVTVESSVSQMRINAGADALNLLDGEITLHPNEELMTDFGLLGGTASYQLKSGSRSLILPTFGRGSGGLWDLQLNRTLPIDLRISTGVGSSDLNLQQLTLTALTIDAGVGKVEVTLPTTGNFAATVNGGVGGITIFVPNTMAAQIDAKAGIGSVRVDGDYVQQDGVYRSPGYDSAIHRVDLTVEGGIGAITVEQVALQ